MSFLSIGDLSSSMRMRLLNADLKQQMATLGNELATGKVSDVSRHLGGGLDRLGAVNRSLRMMDAYQVNTSELKGRANWLQAALAAVQLATESIGAKSIAASNTVTAASIDTAAAAANESLQNAIGALNNQFAGRSLFSGQAFKSPALVSAADILDDLAGLSAAATTSAEVQTIVDDYFMASGGGFETTAYLGSTSLPGEIRVSESEIAGFSVSAATPELREALAGLAMAAILGRSLPGIDLTASADLLKSAGEAMLSATDGIVTIRATLGGIEERIEIVAVGNSARKAGLEITLDEMISADGYETATRLQAAETSLEALYIATSRLSQLSLTRYLR